VTREVLVIVNSMLTGQRKVHNLKKKIKKLLADYQESCRGWGVTDARVIIFFLQPVI
jgi:hypothetical protein